MEAPARVAQQTFHQPTNRGWAWRAQSKTRCEQERLPQGADSGPGPSFEPGRGTTARLNHKKRPFRHPPVGSQKHVDVDDGGSQILNNIRISIRLSEAQGVLFLGRPSHFYDPVSTCVLSLCFLVVKLVLNLAVDSQF